MKYILKIILIILVIGIAFGIFAGMTNWFSDFSFKPDNSSSLFEFADKWQIIAGTGENALHINQDTKAIYVNDLSQKGKGGVLTNFKCDDTTFVDKILVTFLGNSDVWNVGNMNSMTLHGNYEKKIYEFHGYELYENPFVDYYNANKSNLNIQSGSVLGSMQFDITFMFPEYMKKYDELMSGNLSKIFEYESMGSNYVNSIIIPIILV